MHQEVPQVKISKKTEKIMLGVNKTKEETKECCRGVNSPIQSIFTGLPT
jgi:hypothetical protein